MSRALEVWKLVWPNKISVEDYERALLMAQLARDPERGTRRTKQISAKRVTASEPSEGTIDVAGICKRLRVHPTTVCGWIKKGKIKARKAKAAIPGGSRWEVDLADFDAFVKGYGR